MGLETPTEGSISFEERVILGYYAQHQLQILDPEKTVDFYNMKNNDKIYHSILLRP